MELSHSFTVDQAREISRPINVDTYQMSYRSGHMRDGHCEFANRLSSASAALEHKRAGSAGELDAVRQSLGFLGDQLRDVRSKNVEVKSFDVGGRGIKVAATPAGLAMTAEIEIPKALSAIENYSQSLPESERAGALEDVVKSMYPDARINKDTITVGKMQDIRIKTEPRGFDRLKRAGVTALFGSAALLENLTSNAVIGSLNLFDQMTAPPGYSPVPINWYSSDIMKLHRERSQAYSLEEVMRASVDAELLLRECLVHRQGVATPQIDPSRTQFMDSLMASWRQRERDLKSMYDEQHKALQAASYNDQERVRRDHDEKIARYKDELLTDLGLETESDLTFGKKVIRKLEKDPLLGKCLEDSILGQPLPQRLRDDMVTSAMQLGPSRGDILERNLR